MKFDKRNRKQDWSIERSYQRKSLVLKEIAELNRAMNRIDGRFSDLVNQKEIARRKITNKWVYLRQLEAQIKETKEKQVV